MSGGWSSASRMSVTGDAELSLLVGKNRQPQGKDGFRRYDVLTGDGDTFTVFAIDRGHALTLVREYTVRIEGKSLGPNIVSARLAKD